MNRFHRALLHASIVVVVAHYQATIGWAADSPFKGDYAGRSIFTSEEGNQTKGLVLIAVFSDGHIRMSFINKTIDTQYFSKGTINENGQIEETTFWEGKEWGTHKGSLSRAANGNITATIREYAKGKEIPNGTYEIVGGSSFGEAK